MHARAPLDVDLEDKLLYGLTPMRLAYIVVALLASFAMWSSPWAPSPVRATVCLMVAGLGAAAAWGRWRGRALDSWVADISIFILTTRRVTWKVCWPEWCRTRPHMHQGKRSWVPVAIPDAIAVDA